MKNIYYKLIIVCTLTMTQCIRYIYVKNFILVSLKFLCHNSNHQLKYELKLFFKNQSDIAQLGSSQYICLNVMGQIHKIHKSYIGHSIMRGGGGIRVLVFNTTFNNISVISWLV